MFTKHLQETKRFLARRQARYEIRVTQSARARRSSGAIGRHEVWFRPRINRTPIWLDTDPPSALGEESSFSPEIASAEGMFPQRGFQVSEALSSSRDHLSQSPDSLRRSSAERDSSGSGSSRPSSPPDTRVNPSSAVRTENIRQVPWRSSVGEPSLGTGDPAPVSIPLAREDPSVDISVREDLSLSSGTSASSDLSALDKKSDSRQPASRLVSLDLDCIDGLRPMTLRAPSPVSDPQPQAPQHYSIPTRERILRNNDQSDGGPFDANRLVLDVSLQSFSLHPLLTRAPAHPDRSPRAEPSTLRQNTPSLTKESSFAEIEKSEFSDQESDEDIQKLLKHTVADLQHSVDHASSLIDDWNDDIDETSSSGSSESATKVRHSKLFVSPVEPVGHLATINRLIDAILQVFKRRKWRPQISCRRFFGHVNCQTDLKEVSYWDKDGVIGASEHGEIYVWRHSDGSLINVLHGHVHSVNSIRVHPTDAVLASSGIDNYIQLWRPS
eukprot:Gregarina_sp_Poly_1__10157@NODE_697_length_6711_cov_200_540036_g525_i0_p2_GENE_NODE_697_length_6711_cov_200_540036_g525_i0NODE_697_length_6711_cov_200_540036_g525_i0_p2_ORF_typecomplete_len498_score67_88WD40/PF00400_32/1_4e03WD40/PF00400_32/5e06ANAPC4_WD40/PF12894_7/1_4e05WD40_like/PF17005_5/0_027_NODE_697_length_6711_cov_200_540036_g525_i050446537